MKRPDLKTGDKLKVIAKNGNEREYFIKVQSYATSSNASLASISWPDIPNFYKGIFGWIGDTIPNFDPSLSQYRIEVPVDVDGIPALVAKPQDLNATVDVKRATNLKGTTEDRTVAFTVTAEDGKATHTYNVELIKEKDQVNIQPYHAEPFLSEFTWNVRGNSFIEICNPGNQPLDLSNYMIVHMFCDDAYGALTSGWNADRVSWLQRYQRYVPGYKWEDEAHWVVEPGLLELDLNVNSIIQPGDVWVAGAIRDDKYYTSQPGYDWVIPGVLDIQVNNYEGNMSWSNPWGEEVNNSSNFAFNWNGAKFYILKILNDSIKTGLKAANDPNDFEVIEAFGMLSGGKAASGKTAMRRHPEIYKGNPELQASLLSGPMDSENEWNTELRQAVLANQGIGWPWRDLLVLHDLGIHYFHTPTHYMSTISSLVYKVSEGYSMNENIRGLTPGTTVANLLENIIKADSAQSLSVKSVAAGSEMAADAIINLNDTLVVISADSTNTSKYILEVSEEGLSSNAILTSNKYEINIEDFPESTNNDGKIDGKGYVTQFEYGMQLHTIINNVTVPAGATMTVVDNNDAYIPFKKLNFDTVYVQVTVNPNTYLDVLAEDGRTRIVYQLRPQTSEEDAFVLSDVYSVFQKENLIQYLPRGTNSQILLGNLIPSFGASMKLVDKMGYERTEGTVVEDDKVVVTSASGKVQRIYHLSMLPTPNIPATTYLAYVLSDIYSVDQVNYLISGPTGLTLLTEFYSRITPSMGATAVVVDINGNEKNTGDLDDGDMLKVTSADGKIVVMYKLNLDLTSTNEKNIQQIKIHPNPTSGNLNIRGIEPNNRIRLYNSTGILIFDRKAESTVEIFSLANQFSGMYIIVVSNDNQLLGRFKVIKK
jgi:hypothetical protein